ncbi:hypothetical protein ACHQM5_004489 [Ranunculus cassubicifolius]
MASISCDNDNSYNKEEFDRDLLMALLEETRVGIEMEAEDERLDSVIHSLEAEIDPSKDFLFEEIQDCFGSATSDFNDWIDMEMTEVASLSPSDDIGNWYAYTADNELVGMMDFQDDSSKMSEEIGDYLQFCYVDDNVNSSLWQETYDSVMYN